MKGEGRAEKYLSKGLSIIGKLRTSDDLTVALHLLLYLSRFHLCSVSQTLLHGLLREALPIDILYGLAHKLQVFRNQQGIVGQELQDGLFLLYGSQLRHDIHMVATLLRQLVLYLESADRVDLVAKEVEAERELVAIGIDVEDRAAKGKLSWLVDVVHLAETKLTQRLTDSVHADGLLLFEGQSTGIELLARHHHLGKSLGVGNDV